MNWQSDERGHQDGGAPVTGEPLTPGQARIWDAIATGPRTFNGRARKQIKALEARGLVDVDWDMRPHVSGGGMALTEAITVTRRPGAPPPPQDERTCLRCGLTADRSQMAFIRRTGTLSLFRCADKDACARRPAPGGGLAREVAK